MQYVFPIILSGQTLITSDTLYIIANGSDTGERKMEKILARFGSVQSKLCDETGNENGF